MAASAAPTAWFVADREEPLATRIQVTIDGTDPDRLARCWAEALQYRIRGAPGGFDTWQADWVSRGLPEDEEGQEGGWQSGAACATRSSATLSATTDSGGERTQVRSCGFGGGYDRPHGSRDQEPAGADGGHGLCFVIGATGRSRTP